MKNNQLKVMHSLKKKKVYHLIRKKKHSIILLLKTKYDFKGSTKNIGFNDFIETVFDD